MKKVFISFTCVVGALLVAALSWGGCSDSSDTQIQAPHKPDEIKKSPELDELNQRILDVLTRSAPCGSIDECDAVSVSIKPKSPSASSLGQRILVIDSGMVLPAFTRYKSRVLDFLIPGEDGRYERQTGTIQMPRTVFTILSEILDEQHPETPAQQLNAVSDQFHKHVKVLNQYVGHGNENFATLADLNPKAEFVLAQLPDSSRAFKVCSSYDEQAALEEWQTYLDNASLSLRRVIEKHSINFVNMSFGDSKETLRRFGTRAAQVVRSPAMSSSKACMRYTLADFTSLSFR